MGDRVVAVHVQLGTETEDRAAAADLQRRWQEWRPDEALVLLLGVDEDGRPSRVLGPAIAGYLRELATSSTERVLLLIGEVAPHHWWEQVLFNRRARWSPATLRFRLLHRPSTIAPAPARAPAGTRPRICLPWVDFATMRWITTDCTSRPTSPGTPLRLLEVFITGEVWSRGCGAAQGSPSIGVLAENQGNLSAEPLA